MNTKKLIQNSFWIYLFAYLAAPLGYVIRVIYSRTLSLEDFGLLYSLLGFFGLLSIFNDLGFTEALNFNAAKQFAKKNYSKVKTFFLYSLFMQGASAILIAVVLYFLSPFLAEHFFQSPNAENLLNFFLAYFILFNFSRPQYTLFGAAQKFFFVNLFELLRVSIITVFSLFLLDYQLGIPKIHYLAIVWTITYASLTILYYIFLKLKLNSVLKASAKFSKREYKKMLSYSVPTMISNGARMIVWRTDIILITLLLDLSSVGLYSNALALSNLAMLAISPISSMFFPLTSKLSEEKDKNSIKELVSNSYIFGLFLGLPISIFLMVFSKGVVNVLFGNNFLGSVPSVILLSGGVIFLILTTFNFAFLAGLGLPKERMKIMYIVSISNVVLDLILIPIIGIIGAAVATVTGYIIMFLLSRRVLMKNMNFRINRNFLKKIISLNILIAIVYLILETSVQSSFIVLAAIGLISYGVYLIVGAKMKLFDYKTIIFSISSMFKKNGIVGKNTK